jgi:hypothetical protein
VVFVKYQKYLFLIFLVFSLNLFANEENETQLIGNYACTFTQGGYTYDPFRCIIKKTGDQLQLEKTSGSQRIKGEIYLTEKGFNFEGLFFCPYGDCDAAVSGEFKKLSEGQYQGPIFSGGIETIVTLIKKNK